MVIEKVFGLSATSVSLNDRFTLLSAAATVNTAVNTQFRSTPARSTPAYTGRLISDNEEFQPNIKQRLRSRMNIGTLKQQQAWQYNLIKRALLRGTLGQTSVKNRLGLKRGITRGIRNRWNRGNVLQAQRAQRLQFARRSRPFNTQRTRGRGRPRVQGAGFANQQNGVKQTAHRGRPFRGGGRGRGRGRGGITRQQSQPSKEQLDAELEQYMSCTKSALDKQLDEYMQDALMDFTTPE